jgi:glycosyltransferase involved in cell wall biosynthesis
MRILVDGLSATSLSGRHVLLGHLQQLAHVAPTRHEFFVLYHPANSALRRVSSPNVHWIAVPDGVCNWKRRAIWETFSLRNLLRELRADLVFRPSGTIMPACSLPQVSLAQNPWCLTPGLHRGPGERIKAFLQRRAYRHAMVHSTLMAYNSEFMRQAYRKNAGGKIERESLVAYQGLDDETHAAASEIRNRAVKQSHRILAVSVMAPWKNIETLIAALSILRQRKIPASLNLVGPWGDSNYEQAIRRQIDRSGLAAFVEFTGAVAREELYRQYAEATVFCLLSRCESFGIPALEAQLFGTPAVISNSSAMPEICGSGAISVSPDDAAQAADCLAALLENPAQNQDLANAAVENASRFRWSNCSRPLFRMFELAHDGRNTSHVNPN